MLLSFAAHALEIDEITWRDHAYAVVRVDPGDRMLLVGQRDPDQRTLAGALATNPGAVVAMNAGMYHADRRPVGLHVEVDGTFAPLEERPLEGNFGLLPNGVFGVGPSGPVVRTTGIWAVAPVPSRLATQSGPLLVIDGELHPRFQPRSTSLKIRNGIGVDRQGRTWWVVSRDPVRFYDFAQLFRDVLGCPDALYLDGTVSELATSETVEPGGRTFSGVLLAFSSDRDARR